MLNILIFLCCSSTETSFSSNDDTPIIPSNVKKYQNKTTNLNNNAFEATLLFRSLELWMNLHIVRKRNCLEMVMCEGISNIVKEGHTNDIVADAKSIAMMYAEISGYI